MEFLYEHIRGYLGSVGSQFGQSVSCNVEILHNIDDFYTLEVFLKFTDFYAVSIHVFLGAVPILVNLVDDHLGVAIDEQTLDAK